MHTRNLLVSLFAIMLVFGLSAQVLGSEQDGGFEQFMVSHELLEELPAADMVHEYGSRVLVRTRSGTFPRELRSRASELEPISHLSYRSWEGAVDGEDPARLPSVSDGYFVLSLVGPMAPKWRDQIGAHGLTVVDHVSPYGLLVRGSSRDVQAAANEVRTSEDFNVIVHALPLPNESRTARDLRDWLAERASASDLGLRTVGGDALVRVEFHADTDMASADRKLLGHVETGPEHAPGSGVFQYRASAVDVGRLLDEFVEIAFVHGVYPKVKHNNISVQSHIANIEPVWNSPVLDYTGAGIVAGVNDSGLYLDHDDFPPEAVLATEGAMENTDSAHGTHVTGTVAGRGVAPSPVNTSGCGDLTAPLADARGAAWNADIIHNNIFDGGIEEEAAMMQWQAEQGASVNNNSWGYGSFLGPATGYDSESAAVDAAVRDAIPGTGVNEQISIVFAAGNDGSAGVSKPANAKNVITVGASQNDRCGAYVPSRCSGPDIDSMACFSSQGPSQGRIKPDIVAPGTDVLSTRSRDSQANAGPWDQDWAGEEYALNSGTSMAAPLVTGAAAVFYEFYLDTRGRMPSPALVKGALINTATNLGSDFPSNIQGWGRLNLEQALQGPVEDGIVFIDQDDVEELETADSWTTTVGVASDDAPLKITLTWTDPAGSSGCTVCHINDLDLVVTAPDGTVYRGNQFAGAWSEAEAEGRDASNNVENVFIESPQFGEWSIEVVAVSVAENPNLLSGQDFALVASGDFGGISAEPESLQACTSDGSVNYTLELSSQFEGTTSLEADNLPDGTSGDFDPNPVVFPDNESIFTVSDLGAADGGEYTIDISATDQDDSSNFAETQIGLALFENVPGNVSLNAPADGATDQDLLPEFAWDVPVEAAEYRIQVADNEDFNDPVIDEALSGTSLVPEDGLASGTDYYWRVRSSNACGDGDWSDTYTFQTRFEPVAEIDPLSFDLEVIVGEQDEDTLEISNVGTGNLIWSIATDSLEGSGIHQFLELDPSLDEVVEIPDFVAEGAASPEPVEFTFNAGSLTRGDVVGFTFKGTVSNMDGTASSAEDMCMILTAPDGTAFSVGGFIGSSMPECNDNPWGFSAGLGENGTFESSHDDVFDPPVADEGEWHVLFINDWTAASAADMNWSDVTITLHKQPLPVCQGEEYTSVPWLSVSPDSGSVAAGTTDEVTISVDAGELAHGEHVGYLCIETNDTGDDNLKLVAVPVELMVFDPDVGALQGAVTTEDYCSASDPVPVAGATVVAEGQDGTFEMQTDGDGEYYFEINENESPLTVTVSLEGYLNAVEEDVYVNSGETTQQPFNLLLAEPCGDVEPDGFDFDLTLGDTASDTLSLSNEDGNVDLEWTLAAVEGDSCEGDEPGWLTLGADEGVIAPGDSEDVSVSVDTASLADGSYLATLCLDSDDERLGSVQIPVTVDVTDPTLGTVEGRVMALNCQEDPEPLAGALITIEGQGDSWTTSTDADGMYSIKVSEDESPVDVTASADDYFPVTEDGVTIIGLETEEINFDLTLDAACIDASPDEFNVTVDLGQTADESLEIANLGSKALDWAVVLPDENGAGGLATALAEERLAAGLPEVHVSDFVADPADEEAGIDRAPRSVAGPGQPWVTGTARAALLQEGVLLVPQHINDRIMAFDPETGALIDENFIVFEESLGTLQHVLPHPDGERLLVVSQSGEIHAFSAEEGDYLGVFAPTAGDDSDVIGNTRGMAIHPDTGNILVTSASGSNTNAVVEFDQDGNYLGVFIESGSGGISGPWSILFREHDVLVSASGGNIYSYDHNGEFIQVWNNEINFPEQIQEIENGNVLAAAFSAPSGAWELSADGEQIGVYGPETSLRGVHELPGGTILVTNSGGVHEIDRDSNLLGTLIDGSSYQISLVQTMDCELPDWLVPDPLVGSVESGDPADSVILTFDPSGMAPGEYEGNICIESNDPIHPVVQVPVSMEVVLPADWGTVQGSVESLGHCDENPAPLAGVPVSISGQSDSWALETDDEGFYQLFVPAAESPLEIEVSAEGHVTALATVAFGGGDAATENFSLHLDEPCASVSPDEISFSMDADDTRSGIIQLSNSGYAPLSWQIDTTMPSELRRHGATGKGGGGTASGSPHAAAVSLADVLGDALPGLAVGQPLVDVADCSDDPDLIIHDDGTVENGYAWGAANSWGMFVDKFTPEAYPTSIDMVCVAFLRAAGGPSSIDFEVVFYADDGPGGEPGTEIAAVQATAVSIPDGIDEDPSWTAVDVSEADVSIAAGSVYIGARWAPSAPNVFIGADESTDRPAGYAGGYSASDQGSGGDWESILSGFDEYRALFVRAAGGGMNCSDPIGVPWLSVNPAFGPAIGAGQSQDINVELDSAGLLPGEYSAGLCIFTNDPGNPVTMVPVELEVRAPAAWAAVEGVVESAGYCSSEPGALADATVELVGSTDSWTAVTDDDGHYSISLPASEGPVDIHVEADGHEPETLTGIALSSGQTVTEDFSLTLQAPCATADPDRLEFALTAGESAIHRLEIGNVDGTIDLEWSIEEAPQVDSRAHFPALPYQAEHKSADGISLYREDVSDSAGSLVNSPLMPAEMTVPAFSTTGWTAPGYAMLDALAPGVLDIINPNQPEDVYAAAFIDNDLDRHYMIVSGNDGNQPANTFGYVEVATGEFTGLGTLSGDLAETWTSMSWDHTTGTLYASGSTLLGNSLFVIDPDALTATEVGEITGPGLAPGAIIIAIAVSPEGLMYGLDIIDDVLLAIDKSTGEASVIGPTGHDANFAQDMDFDQSDGTLYWAGYMGGGDSRMMTIDVETGAASQVGAVDDGVELLSFTIAIPGRHGDACVVRESVEWLGFLPVSGNIPGGESETVYVQADAGELEAGEYEAWLCIDTSDEERPLIAVPVTLDVDAPPAEDLIFEDRFEDRDPAP